MGLTPSKKFAILRAASGANEESWLKSKRLTRTI